MADQKGFSWPTSPAQEAEDVTAAAMVDQRERSISIISIIIAEEKKSLVGGDRVTNAIPRVPANPKVVTAMNAIRKLPYYDNYQDAGFLKNLPDRPTFLQLAINEATLNWAAKTVIFLFFLASDDLRSLITLFTSIKLNITEDDIGNVTVWLNRFCYNWFVTDAPVFDQTKRFEKEKQKKAKRTQRSQIEMDADKEKKRERVCAPLHFLTSISLESSASCLILNHITESYQRFGQR